MEPGRAAAFLLEAAEALASAHNAGLAHLCLTPHNLVWTSGGTVKVTGLGVEAVPAGTTSDVAGRRRHPRARPLLYAALTGALVRPGGHPASDRARRAPTGARSRPASCAPACRHNLDDIICRSLHLPLRGAQEPSERPVGLRRTPLSQGPALPAPLRAAGGLDAARGAAPAPTPRPSVHAWRRRRGGRPAVAYGARPPRRHTQPRQPSASGTPSPEGEGGISRPVLAAIIVGRWPPHSPSAAGAVSRWAAAAPTAEGRSSRARPPSRRPCKLGPLDAKGYDSTPGTTPTPRPHMGRQGHRREQRDLLGHPALLRRPLRQVQKRPRNPSSTWATRSRSTRSGDHAGASQQGTAELHVGDSGTAEHAQDRHRSGERHVHGLKGNRPRASTSCSGSPKLPQVGPNTASRSTMSRSSAPADSGRLRCVQSGLMRSQRA